MSDMILIGLAIYGAGYCIVQLLVRWVLDGERTAHGQIVGRQIGFVIGILWPIAIPVLIAAAALVSIDAGVRWAIRRVRRK